MPARGVREQDAEQKVTGQIPYALNVALPGMVYARCVRSPHAHARLVRVGASRAEALPGVVAVLTRDDLVDGRLFPYYGAAIKDQPLVAIDKARHVGDVVAAVAAESAEAAAEAAELVEVEYEELPAVFDPESALAEGAPLIHEEPPRPGPTFADIIMHTGANTNVCNYFKLRKGDVEQGFA